VRDLIRRISIENPLWSAPRIHGELLKLGIDVAQSTVSIYMVPRQGRPLQTWKTFLRNHMGEIASIDLFVVPTIAFRRLFVCLVLGHRRRQLLGFAVIEHQRRIGWRVKSPKHFSGTRRPNISSMTGHLAAYSRVGCEPWGSGTSRPRTAHPWQNGHADRVGPARVHGSFDRVQRGAPSPDPCAIRKDRCSRT
jgi:hypothetical protein